MKRKIANKKSGSHFLWSIFFMTLTAILNIYFVGLTMGMGYPPTWPLAASIAAGITVILICIERKNNILGKGTWLWSIFFAAITLAITLYMAGGSGYAFLPNVSCISSLVALILLIREKYI